MSNTPPPAEGWRQGPDGKWYGPDDDQPTAPPPPPPIEEPASGAASVAGENAGDEGGDGKNKSRALLLGGAAVAVVLVVLLAVILSSGDDQRTLTGQFTLSDRDSISGQAESCRGTGGYSDFGPGMNVTIRNGSGEIVASSNTQNLDADAFYGSDEADELEDQVDEGEDDMSPQELADAIFDFLGCTVVFKVDVPDEEFYAIEVGRRGELSYSQEELEEVGWNVSLTLGD